MSILTSPYLTLPLLDAALRAAEGGERVRLLAAKVALLQADASASASGSSSGSGLGRARREGEESTMPESAPAQAPAPATAPTPAPAQAPTSAPPATARTPSPCIPLLAARLELAHAYAGGEPHAAAAEAMAVEGECRRLMRWVGKRAGRGGRGGGPSGAGGRGAGGDAGEDEDDRARDARGQRHEQEQEHECHQECQRGKEGTRSRGSDTLEDRSAETTPAPPWLAEITRLRAEALGLLVRVEEGLGRPARAERWRRMADA